MNKLTLVVWIAIASFCILISSCGKENYDLSDSTQDEFEPTTNYPGEDNLYSFAFTIITPDNTNTSGGIAVDNKITLIDSDLLKWQLTSIVQDGDFTVQANTTFFTPNMDGGTFPLEKLNILIQDGGGGNQDFSWLAGEIEGDITISNLTGTPEFASGSIDVFMSGPGLETNYQYVVEFSKIPLD